jgi:hypothetical protein
MFCIGLKATTTTWTGAAGTANWNTASNWSNGVPTDQVKAIIGNVTTGRSYPNNAPTSGSAAAAIEIAAGSTLTLPSTFYTPNGIINNGTINISGSGIFYGFGSGSSYSNLFGTGKLVFGSASPTTFDSAFLGQILNNSIELNNPAGLTLTNATTFTGNVTLTSGIVTMGASQTFIMNNPNASLTGSFTSYINGILRRTVNSSGNYTFPVGLASVYAPASITLNGLVGTTTITANYSSAAIDGLPNNIAISGQTVNTLLSAASWLIDANIAPTAGSYSVSLSAPIGSSTANNYYVLKRSFNNSFIPWENLGINVASTVNAGTVTASVTGLTSFSQFGIGEGVGTLPVKLVKFLASADAKTAKLYWETASELNNDKFEIERSTNGTDFAKIGEVKGNGTSQKLNIYNFKDFAPANGINYFRLKQLDFDGKFEYSDVRFVNFDLGDLAINIYPNPVSEVLNFSQSVKNVTIYNLQGAMVYQFKDNTNAIKIPITVNSGIYILKFNSLDDVAISKQILISK